MQLEAPPSILDVRTKGMMALIARLDSLDLTQILVYRIASAPASVLDYLAWQFDLQSPYWALLVSTATKRTLLQQAIYLHRVRGTPYAIKTAVTNLGYPGATLSEGQASWGGHAYPASQGWAVYRINVPAPGGGVPSGAVAAITAACNFFAPARCRLDQVVFT